MKLKGINRSIKSINPTGGTAREHIEFAAIVIYDCECTLGTIHTIIRSFTVDVGL